MVAAVSVRAVKAAPAGGLRPALTALIGPREPAGGRGVLGKSWAHGWAGASAKNAAARTDTGLAEFPTSCTLPEGDEPTATNLRGNMGGKHPPSTPGTTPTPRRGEPAGEPGWKAPTFQPRYEPGALAAV